MSYETVLKLLFLCLSVGIVLPYLVSAMVIDIHNKIVVKKAKKFLKENPRFETYATAWLLFDQKRGYYERQIIETKKSIKEMIDNQIYVKEGNLFEYLERIEELREILESYQKDKEINVKKQEQVQQQMFDYMKEKFPKLSSDKIENKMWLCVDCNTKKWEE